MDRMKIIYLLSVLLITFLTGCRKGDSPTTEEEAKVKDAGEAASRALLQNLSGQLKSALQAGGPASAMQACQQVAVLTTTAIGGNYEGVTVRRTTLRPRNPGNAPDEIDVRVLEYLEASTDLPPHHIEWTSTEGRYYKPLVIQEVCLKCHGEPSEFSAELKSKLATLYPNDKATGYGLGELRGVIRVDVER